MEVKLKDEEIAALAKHAFDVDNKKSALGNLVYQFENARKKFIEDITKSENDYLSFLKQLAKNNNIDLDKDAWAFSYDSMSFIKDE